MVEQRERAGKSPRWTDREAQKLKEKGIAILNLKGKTIQDQITARESLIVSAHSTIVPSTSRIDEIGIFTAFNDFFVPGTSSATLRESEKLVQKDTEELRKRLGITNLTGIIPDNVATVTELILLHAKKTGVWLLGLNWALGDNKDYQHEMSSLLAVRTKNPMIGNDKTKGFAVVSFEALFGSIPPRLRISMFEDKYLRNCNMAVATMRFLVPAKK